MSRDMIVDMHRRGHLVLNHSHSHPHMVRRQPDESQEQWLSRIRGEIEQAATLLQQWTGEEPMPVLAWPYGEQVAPLRQLARDMGLTAFGQHSGALDAAGDWQNLPRVAVNRHYADWRSLREKLLALPLPVRATLPADGETREARPELTLVLNRDWRQRGVQCYVGSRVIRPTVRFSDGVSELRVRADADIPLGRSRYNCTAAAGGGRWYWLSWVWMRRDDDDWYPES